VRSFIRWAGSKRLSLPYLRPYCRPPRGKYIEPFAGSACLFFELEPSSAILGDLNRELISAMRAIRRDVYRVLECLRRLRTGKAAYYKIRRSVTGELSDPELAARFLYINRHCFNGLYRTNQRGEFPPRYRSALADAENTFRNGSPAQGCLLVQQEIEQLSRRIARKTQTKNLWRPLKPGERAPRFSDKTAWARVTCFNRTDGNSPEIDAARPLDRRHPQGPRVRHGRARPGLHQHPVLAQIIPARFCNLSCAYCNEYDKVSEPVPLDEMFRRIDHLGRLGTAMIGISGGEPLTHPQLDDIIRRMRKTGAIAGMITNGYLLNVERIERLNRAGLDHMQISHRQPGARRSLEKEPQVLDKRLQMLAEYAEFHVNINSVVGGGIQAIPTTRWSSASAPWSWASSPPSASSTTARPTQAAESPKKRAFTTSP
jgi:hypothetical protein